MKRSVFLIFLICLFHSCKEDNKGNVIQQDIKVNAEPDQNRDSSNDKAELLLENCIEAHGGLERWKSFEALEYHLNDKGKKVYQLTHLIDRRSYIESKEYKVGFNGEVAWALPDASKVSGQSAAFYYNLDFYFVGLPFLLKDPGVNVSYVEKDTINGSTYDALKISFGKGVGFTPEDVYYMYLHPDTHMLSILTYSISYFDKNNAPINSAKVYSEYVEVQGIMMPTKMENFEWANGKIGASKHHLRIFSDFKFFEKLEDESIFNVPDGAVVETLN